MGGGNVNYKIGEPSSRPVLNTFSWQKGVYNGVKEIERGVNQQLK